jgi:hypothetical protein
MDNVEKLLRLCLVACATGFIVQSTIVDEERA